MNVGWGLRGSCCLWATFPKASHPGLQGLGQGGGEGLEGWRLGRGKRETAQDGPGQGANYGARGGCVQSAMASGLGGEEQAGELTATAVSVHKGQRVLCVVPDHGSHGGEQLDRNEGHQ